MTRKLTIAFFIDALGWTILQRYPDFLKEVAPHRQKLRTILGYSNACDPSIISGKLPQEHLHWSSWYYSPETSPFKSCGWLQYIPSFLSKRARIRGWLSRLLKKQLGITGYFQLYQVPFEYLSLFDYGEKKRIWEPGGLNRGETIFDELAKHHIPYYVGDQVGNDAKQVEIALNLIRKQEVNFLYLLMGQLDGLMHAVGTHHSDIDRLMEAYHEWGTRLFREAEKNYDEVNFLCFSDHGMHDVTEGYDLQSDIHTLSLTYAKDYIAIYDSTIARFWFLHQKARDTIIPLLQDHSKGKLLSDQELQELGIYFPDHRYGEAIFLMNPGTLIVPSFMNRTLIKGMHGYHPDEEDAMAMLIQNTIKESDPPGRIEELYSHFIKLLRSEIAYNK